MEWTGPERRRYSRAEFPCKIFVGAPIRLLHSHTENISEGGIKVILEEKLRPFTIVGLEIFVDKEKPIKCKGKVIWVKERVNPLERKPVSFETGIEFIEIADCDREYIRKLVDKLLSQKEE